MFMFYNRSNSVQISVVASGCIGQMFRLYKNRQQKYQEELKVMSAVIIPHNQKTKTHLPVELTAWDHGGLYVISLDYLPALRHMDDALMEAFQLASHQQQDFAKVQIMTFVGLNNEISCPAVRPHKT